MHTRTTPLFVGCLLVAAMTLGPGCTQRNPYNPAEDGGPLPDSGGQLDSGGRLDSGGQLDSGGRLDSGGPLDGAPPTDAGGSLDGNVGGCTSNKQCAPTHFCQYPVGTCGKSPGTCSVRSQGCPEIYSPVCGCDGKTHGNACEAHALGISVDYPGQCKGTKTCSQLNQDYIAAVAQAKQCQPMLPVLQCQVLVDNALHCACPTYVEQGNGAAFALLSQIKQQFKAAGCVPYQCGMPCPNAQPGNCMPSSTGSGTCQ